MRRRTVELTDTGECIEVDCDTFSSGGIADDEDEDLKMLERAES